MAGVMLTWEHVNGCRVKVFANHCLAMDDFFVKLFRLSAVMSQYFRIFFLPEACCISIANICGLMPSREIITIYFENETTPKNSRSKVMLFSVQSSGIYCHHSHINDYYIPMYERNRRYEIYKGKLAYNIDPDFDFVPSYSNKPITVLCL
jgi:hypothetical protein